MGPFTTSRVPRWLVLALDAVYLCAILAFAVYYMMAGLSRSWFFSSDEYVIGGEVIRFLHLDFRQRFWDMPGTPFMFLTALVWAAYYGLQALIGATGGAGIGLFTFLHIEGLFVLMRVLTLLFFCLSVVLLYALAARLTNRFGAWLAALLLATSPSYTAFSSYVRIESLAMCLMLGSLLCASQWTRPPRRPLVWAAGVLGGLAVACRFHAVFAILPPLLLFLVDRRWQDVASDYPRWAKRFFGVAALAVAALAALVLAGRQAVFGPFPRAWTLLLVATVAMAVGVVVVWTAYQRPGLRRLLLRVVPPETADLLCACVVGVLLGAPPVLWEAHRVLQSIETYRTSYFDPERAAWPLWTNITWYVAHYLKVGAAMPAVLGLLVAGVVLAVVLRHRDIVWIAVAALLFFVSKPLSVRAAAHHMIMWLPYYAIVAAYPLATLWTLTRRRPNPARVAALAILVAC